MTRRRARVRRAAREAAIRQRQIARATPGVLDALGGRCSICRRPMRAQGCEGCQARDVCQTCDACPRCGGLRCLLCCSHARPGGLVE